MLARLGDLEGAEQAIREARAIVEPTDYLTLRAYAALSLAEVERAAGRIEREREALEEAVRLSELKGDVVTAASARAAIEAIGPAASAAP